MAVLSSDGGDGRKQINKAPFNFKNVLVMRSKSEKMNEHADLPSLTELRGSVYNFYCIGSVILESGSLGIHLRRHPTPTPGWSPTRWRQFSLRLLASGVQYVLLFSLTVDADGLTAAIQRVNSAVVVSSLPSKSYLEQLEHRGINGGLAFSLVSYQLMVY